MCGRIKKDGRTFRPGARLPAFQNNGEPIMGQWDGFARIESIQAGSTWWATRRYQRVVVPADDFAERDRHTESYVWNGKKATIWALKRKKDAERLNDFDVKDLVIVTREASRQEEQVFGHNRVPLTTADVPLPNGWATPAEQGRLL